MIPINFFDLSQKTLQHERRLSGVSAPQPDRRINFYLNQLEMPVNYFDESDFYGHLGKYQPEISLFFINESQLQDRKFLSAFDRYLDANPSSANIGLIHSVSEITNPILLKKFDDFLYWPCSFGELRSRINQFFCSDQRAQPEQLLSDTSDLVATFSKLNLCGQSPKFIQALKLIKKISLHQAAVLIQGETGTGKENAARAIHYLGLRSACAFVPINCATIPDDLLESELFGHEKGAFTDARQKQEGLVSLANGGTLFLDEVDSLSSKAQAALLRFLQTQEYRPVGSKQFYRANVRIIAATNADLKKLSETKQFREDLFFRLNVMNLVMPPLRQRVDDLPIIAETLVKRFSEEYQMPLRYLSERSLRYLKQQSWRGNVREFENLLLRNFLLSSGKYIEIETLDDSMFERDYQPISQTELLSFSYLSDECNADNFQDAKALAIEQFEKSYLTRLMAISRGNVSLAAKMAGKERRALGKLLQKYEIDKVNFRQANIH